MLYRGKPHFEDRKMQKISAAKKIITQKRLLLIRLILRRRLHVRRKKAFDLTPLGEDGASDTLTCGIQQLDALEKLLEHKTDVMLVAKTSFGKSLIFQLAPLLMPGPGEPGIALILMPHPSRG
jgi:hypothetical protein